MVMMALAMITRRAMMVRCWYSFMWGGLACPLDSNSEKPLALGRHGESGPLLGMLSSSFCHFIWAIVRLLPRPSDSSVPLSSSQPDSWPGWGPAYCL